MKLLGPYRALDSVFEIRSHPVLAEPLASALADLSTTDVPTDRLVVRHRRRSGWTCRWKNAGHEHSGSERTEDDGEALHDALGNVSAAAARSASASDAVLHGGAVRIDGRGVAFVGSTESGTSLLTAAAALHGDAYIADEVTAVNARGHIRSFCRPIGLRVHETSELNIDVPSGPFAPTFPFRVAADAQGVEHTPLGALFLVRNSATDRCETLDPADALVELYRNSVGAAGTERDMFARLETIVRNVPVYLLGWRSARSGLQQVRNALG